MGIFLKFFWGCWLCRGIKRLFRVRSARSRVCFHPLFPPFPFLASSPPFRSAAKAEDGVVAAPQEEDEVKATVSLLASTDNQKGYLVIIQSNIEKDRPYYRQEGSKLCCTKPCSLRIAA
jgi:hypothetical protein